VNFINSYLFAITWFMALWLLLLTLTTRFGVIDFHFAFQLGVLLADL
jgi:hypothetical protein